MNNTQKITVIILLASLCLILAEAQPAKLECNRALEDQNLPDPSHCSRYFRCIYGQRVPKECPEKMLFNPTISNCDMYYNVDCPSKTSSADEAEEARSLAEAIKNLTGIRFARNPKISAELTLQSDGDSREEKHTVTKSGNESGSTKKFVYLPHENDRSAYYRIVNGEKVFLRCDNDMVFNFDLEICAN